MGGLEVGKGESDTVVDDPVAQHVEAAPRIQLLDEPGQELVPSRRAMDGGELGPLRRLGVFDEGEELHGVERRIEIEVVLVAAQVAVG